MYVLDKKLYIYVVVARSSSTRCGTMFEYDVRRRRFASRLFLNLNNEFQHMKKSLEISKLFCLNVTECYLQCHVRLCLPGSWGGFRLRYETLEMLRFIFSGELEYVKENQSCLKVCLSLITFNFLYNSLLSLLPNKARCDEFMMCFKQLQLCLLSKEERKKAL